jgi:hypothetical protein
MTSKKQQRARILIVEDDPVAARLAMDVLESTGRRRPFAAGRRPGRGYLIGAVFTQS